MPTMETAPALLLVAHGTRVPEGAEEMARLVAELRDRHDGPVAHCWLEDFAEPDARTAVGQLAAEGVRRVVALPFLNFTAYHARTDVPDQLAEARQAHPDVAIALGDVLGHHPALLDLGAERVRAAAGEPRPSEALVVVASGSSDAGSNSDVAKAARLLAERTGHRWVEHAFAGVTWPSTEEALARVHRAGAQRAVVFSWSLLAGLLEQRVREAGTQAAAATGLEVVDAGRFGPDPLVGEAALDRYRHARAAAGWD